jgi:hypothetical protein
VVVNYSGTSGGGGNFVPYTGATGDVDLGEYELKAGQVEFDQTPTGTAGVAVMRWNDSDGTVDLGLKGGNVTLQVGQEQILRVVNKTGANLLESQYRAVRIRLAAEGGSQGQRLAVVLAQGNNDTNSTDTIGIVTENITDNQEGFICTSGIIRGINTTGSLQGETWADGDIIYLSPTTPGVITKVKPTAPDHSVILGYVIYAHNVNGKIFVKCETGYEIGELHDCYLPTPSNNDGIFWNSTNLRYENKTVAGALGFTPVSGSGATGQVSYWNGTGSQTGSNNLFWDAANNRLGIGTATPTDKLHVAGTAKFTDNVSIVKTSNPYLVIDNTGTGGKSFTFVSASDGTFQLQNTGVSIPLTISYTGESTFSSSVTANQLIINNVNTPGAKFYRNVDVGTFGEAGQGIEFGAKTGSTYVSSAAIYGGLEVSGTSGNLSFRTLNSGTLTERARFTAAGRLLLGTTSESTYIFDAVGTARVSSTFTIGNNSDNAAVLVFSSPSSKVSWWGSQGAANQFVNNSSIGDLFIRPNAPSSTQYFWKTLGNLGEAGYRYQFTTGQAIYKDNGTTFTTYASAIFSLDSISRGFLPPRMTTTQRDAIASPATGLQVYDTTLGSLNVYNGTAWVALGAGGGGTTIYSGDGTLAGDRIVTSNGNSLTILGGKEEYAGSPVSLRLQGDTTNKSPHFSIKNTNASGFDYTFRSLTDGNFELINYTTLTTILKIKSQYFQIRSSANSFLFGVESNTLPGLWIGVDAGSQTLTNSTLLKNGNDTILSSNSLVRFYNGTTDTGRIYASTGNWVIQTGGTFSDAGYKLDVNGTARVSGDIQINGVFRETVTTSRQTASYTLALTDNGKLVEMNVATANNLTVPLNSSIAFPVGTKIDIAQYGAGQTTVVATGGVTVRSAGGALKLTSQYSGATLVKIATDEWYLFGNITT